jgi:membrane protein DedA with SNARE-associated domain
MLSAIPNSDFTATLQWLVRNGYVLMFIAMIVEGPLVIMAASFAASQGYFSVLIVFLLAVCGDMIGDSVWFITGYFGRQAIPSRLRNRLGISEERLQRLKSLLERHPAKTLAAIKISPLTPIPGLLIAGGSHMSRKKFAVTISLIIIPKTVLFVALGYFFGHAYNKVSIFVNSATYALLIVVVLAILCYYGYRRFAKRIAEKIQG